MLTFLTPGIQNLVALLTVAGAALWLARRARRKKSGCSSCPAASPPDGPRDSLIRLDAIEDRTDLSG